MVQKIKSVLCSGTKSNLVCVPSKKPLPCNRPEPMAILACVTFQPTPRGSMVGSTSTLMRLRWCFCSTLLTKKSTPVTKSIIAAPIRPIEIKLPVVRL